MRSGSLLTIDGARHEILQEADIYREQFLAAFDAFIPGTGEQLMAVKQWRARQRCRLMPYPCSMSSAAFVQVWRAAATISPPFSAGPPSQLVTMPPAFSMIGISADDIVGLQPDLDHEVDMAGRNHRIGVAVGAVASELDAEFQPVVGFALTAQEERRRRGAKRCLVQRGRPAASADSRAARSFIVGAADQLA